jgi:hypothetical protein
MRIKLILLLCLSLSFLGFSQEVKTKEEIKLERKNKRISKRFVHPKSVFIKTSLGAGFSKMKFSEKTEYFNRSFRKFGALYLSIETEIGTKSDFFYELGLNLRNYSYTFSVKDNDWSEKNPRNIGGFLIYGGYGKRISLRESKINIVNVQAGLSFFILSKHYDLGSIEPPTINHEFNFDYVLLQENIKIQNRIIPTFYLEVSKDVRLYKRFYFTMNYRYDLGFMSLYKQKFVFYKKSNPNEVTTVYNHFKGTAHSFSVGLKYRFLPKKFK